MNYIVASLVKRGSWFVSGSSGSELVKFIVLGDLADLVRSDVVEFVGFLDRTYWNELIQLNSWM